MSTENVVPFFRFPKPGDVPRRTAAETMELIKQMWGSLETTINNPVLFAAINAAHVVFENHHEELVFRSEDVTCMYRGDAEYWEGKSEPEYDYVIELTLKDNSKVKLEYYGAGATVLENVVSLSHHRDQASGFSEVSFSKECLNKYPENGILIMMLMVTIHHRVPGYWLSEDLLEYRFTNSPDSKIIIRPATPTKE